MTWSAQQYLAFEQERTRPVKDLVAAIPSIDVRSAVDLGCGPGNSTEILAHRFPEATVSGIDSSEEMLVAAQQRLPTLQFELSEISTWAPTKRFDVILANASLQWLGNHDVLYPKLLSKLSGDGCLAVQIPDNLDEPAHRLAREVAANGPWSQKIGSVIHHIRHDASFYYELLRENCSAINIWRTTYYHPLAGGAAAIVEWFKGTALRPYLTPLEDAERSAFLEQYLANITEAYPALPDGTVLLPFSRLFLVASR
ncbi:trans-aconitate 2-methyltransferase [Methylobacillus caricis]|uniref:trans-aconitate 2-methyltransferase n=1 Tax=Methylobacillus caricis TaxID=1971611 RepID=UPI001CFF9A09|nr:trans-aconitate 2-methyltransferase [Methylobacillus caricis]MCB5186778.1 trans-aconitate 2-methyltransferase [Methylobacillus caricis]